MAKMKKWRGHTVEFKRQVVERMKTCQNIQELAREPSRGGPWSPAGGMRLQACTKGTLSPQNFSISGRASVEKPVERNLRRPACELSYSGCRSR